MQVLVKENVLFLNASKIRETTQLGLHKFYSLGPLCIGPCAYLATMIMGLERKSYGSKIPVQKMQQVNNAILVMLRIIPPVLSSLS